MFGKKKSFSEKLQATISKKEKKINKKMKKRPESKRPKMPLGQRAKQFAPFDALTGLTERLQQAIDKAGNEMHQAEINCSEVKSRLAGCQKQQKENEEGIRSAEKEKSSLREKLGAEGKKQQQKPVNSCRDGQGDQRFQQFTDEGKENDPENLFEILHLPLLSSP